MCQNVVLQLGCYVYFWSNFNSKFPFFFTQQNTLTSYPEDFYWNLGEWENRGCGEKRAYICSKPASPEIPIGNSFFNPYNCPTGWIPHESSCFKVEVQRKALSQIFLILDF